MPLYIGIDLGTQGARALAVDSAGTVQARAERAFPAATLRAPQPGWFEQSPLAWREAVLGALGEISQALGSRRAEVAAVAACGTSGTLCLVDASGEPLGEAIMYADTRATAEAEEAGTANIFWALCWRQRGRKGLRRWQSIPMAWMAPATMRELLRSRRP